MSEKLLRFFLLSEIDTVRLVCKNPSCKAVSEIPIAFLENKILDGLCPVCKTSLNVVENNQKSPIRGQNCLTLLAQVFASLGKDSVNLDVEFVLPAKDVCKLDRKE